ncbi:50S ribosomal protein L3 [Gammaproteobacteria bacterium SCGC AG-212-F23]|nr:50S ribosomal protein L3 [Gammaproteobacteria bacterium SCGC AG-212-F23]
MNIGLVGRKCGMTRVFTEEGVSIPVTVIEVAPNRITQIKTQAKDGYNAIQVTTGTRKKSRLTKPAVGHFAAAGVEPGRGLWEFRTDGMDASQFALNAELKVDHFKVGQIVDVIGTSKGKGFAGVIKKYHFAAQDATHGNSLSHRAPGSIGQRQSPGKVFKGKKMCGHMGNERKTVLSQKIVKIDQERNLIMIKGGVPGAPNGDVIIRPAVKASDKHRGG